MRQSGRRKAAAGWFAREHLALEREVFWLVLLSLLDFFLTYLLLWQEGRFYESNPLASWFYHRFNVAGLIAYKLILIGGVIAICELVERVRPGVGRAVLRLGCLAAGAVVVYSVHLLQNHL